MDLHGHNLIGSARSSLGRETFSAIDPSRSGSLAPPFHEATKEEVDKALLLAAEAFAIYRHAPPQARAAFLQAIAEEIEALGDALITRAVEETALGAARITSERGRTVGQLRMFAGLVEEGSWVDARIDKAIPDRQPLPKPDIRRMLLPLGPVVVFGASNFPLAFSVAGGDTASALAAGCSVVVKAHPAHPGTSELVGRAILKAAERTGMPEGVVSLLHGKGHEVGLALVRHPQTKAVGFTGSLKAGRALYDAAAARPDPIPVYAEMGSINPVFVLPEALNERGGQVAEGLVQSVTLGVGQFCTNPGLVVGIKDQATASFIERVAERIENTPPGTMLYAGICEGYSQAVQRASGVAGVTVVATSRAEATPEKTEAGAAVLTTDAKTFLDNPDLGEEVFGPATLIVQAESREELLRVARGLEGHLTATIHGSEEELESYHDLITVLETKVGRLLFNGFPTGVEVCPSMQHGGPYPATTDARSTSVGTAAIYRFAKPVAYQNFPQGALPDELKDSNPRGIWRLVDGAFTKD